MRTGDVYRLDDGTEVVLLGERGSGATHQWKVFFLDTNDVDNVDSSGKWGTNLVHIRGPTADEKERVRRVAGVQLSVRKRLGDFVRKSAMSENSVAEGGALVPQELLVGVDRVLEETSIFHALAWNVPMGSRSIVLPSVDLSSAGAGDSPLVGGMSLKWTTTEGTGLTETEPSFAGTALVAATLQGVAYVSNQLVADGGEALGAYLERIFAAAIRSKVEYACFNGTSDGPEGVVYSPATVVVNRAGSTDVVQVDLSKMVAALLPACYINAVWAMNPTALQKVSALASFVPFQYKGAIPSLCGYVYGRPLYATEKLPVLGQRGDVVLFDPTMYALGTRLVEIAVSRHARFTNNQTTFRVTWRGNGATLPRQTCTLADGSTTAGCFVALN